LDAEQASVGGEAEFLHLLGVVTAQDAVVERLEGDAAPS
jgi:hypothetical protein